MDRPPADQPTSTSEYLFVYYEELGDFRIRKTQGPHLRLLAKTLQTDIELILTRCVQTVVSVTKSCSERYIGVETIASSVFLLICTILSILVFNKNLLQNSLVLYLLILGPIFLSTGITIVLCQVSKHSRQKRKSAISQKLGVLIDELNLTFSQSTLRIDLGSGSFVGNSMDFSLVFSVSVEVTKASAVPKNQLSKPKHTVPSAKEGQQQVVTASTAFLGPSKSNPQIPEADGDRLDENSPFQIAGTQKPTRLKGRVMTISPTMRRTPKISTIIQTGKVQPRSVNYIKAI